MKKIIVFACLLASCGGGQSSPVAPTPGAPGTSGPTLVALSISASAFTLLVGSSQSITANGRYSDGSNRSVAATWSSAAPDVIAVDNGRLTALSAGLASVVATFEGQSAVAEFRGLPDFSGRWVLEWGIVGCNVPARWGDGFCNVSGTVDGILTLSRADGDQLTGTYDNGVGWSGSVVGQVSIDGTLAVTGRLVSERTTQRWTADLHEWRARLSSSSGMTGTYRELLMLGGESDQGIVSLEIVSASR